jgi:hypothetical protein
MSLKQEALRKESILAKQIELNAVLQVIEVLLQSAVKEKQYAAKLEEELRELKKDN